jgi:hypothetical protein
LASPYVEGEAHQNLGGGEVGWANPFDAEADFCSWKYSADVSLAEEDLENPFFFEVEAN